MGICTICRTIFPSYYNFCDKCTTYYLDFYYLLQLATVVVNITQAEAYVLMSLRYNNTL